MESIELIAGHLDQQPLFGVRRKGEKEFLARGLTREKAKDWLIANAGFKAGPKLERYLDDTIAYCTSPF